MDSNIGISRARLEALSQELARANQRRMRDLRESLDDSRRAVAQQTRAAAGDRVELSDEAVALSRTEDTTPRSDAERAERAQALRELHEQGQLNTPERIARAAERLLSGSEEA